MGIEHVAITANGLAFSAIALGQGPLVLCLHGFPDTPWSFHPQIEALADAGHRVVAPFMRGFAPTAIPSDGRYQGAVLAEDVAGLIAALGDEPAVVVGHDWGASAAYATAILFPERVRRLVTLAVPYGPAMRQALVQDPVQQRRSWYMYLFTTAMGEPALAADDFALIDRLWRDWSPGWSPPPAHMAGIKAMFREPGVAGAALAYYRQTFRPDLQDPALAERQARIGREPIAIPALYLHGADDGCVGADIGRDMGRLFTAGLTTTIVPNAGHFLQMEQAGAVSAAILDFLRHGPAPGR